MKHKTKLSVIYIAFMTLFVMMIATTTDRWLDSEETLVFASELTPTPTTTPTPVAVREDVSTKTAVVENEEVRKIIKEVFGEHADKAFKLLSCENASLNPKAVNTAGNTPKGSRDIGVMQINEYWQGVHAKFLFDPELNVRIGYKIFKDSDYTFKMWSCGKKLGI